MSEPVKNNHVRLRIEIEDGFCEIEKSALTIGSVLEDIVIPALVSMGYAQESVRRAMYDLTCDDELRTSDEE